MLNYSRVLMLPSPLERTYRAHLVEAGTDLEGSAEAGLPRIVEEGDDALDGFTDAPWAVLPALPANDEHKEKDSDDDRHLRLGVFDALLTRHALRVDEEVVGLGADLSHVGCHLK